MEAHKVLSATKSGTGTARHQVLIVAHKLFATRMVLGLQEISSYNWTSNFLL